MRRNQIGALGWQLRLADAALCESESLIEHARVLESPEVWIGASSTAYRQIREAREALRRLDAALIGLDKRLYGVRSVK
jgi:hypothetical protein